jgi:hypothetical protein
MMYGGYPALTYVAHPGWAIVPPFEVSIRLGPVHSFMTWWIGGQDTFIQVAHEPQRGAEKWGHSEFPICRDTDKERLGK